jgi:energy-coupling factor transporter ATP-binding protein EcfA2
LRLIRSVEIERFRSFETGRLEDLSDMTVLVGANNSGKSNVIRALNLFFNDETDPDQYVDFDVDYHLASVSKKKKQIRVAVEFDLPRTFQYRKRLEGVGKYLGRRFRIRKTYALAAPFGPELEVARGSEPFERVKGDQAENARAFLRLVSFRYIPNRAIPVEMIRDQARGLLKELGSRARGSAYRSSNVDAVISDLERSARTMMAAIAADVKQSCTGIDHLELDTPTGLHDMLSRAAFRAVGPMGVVADTSLGAGAQSLLMFHVLHLIDSAEAMRGFGWRQATVWGVEEPESSLHRELQVRLAALLRSYVRGGSRFQIIATTHNEIFVYSADSGFAVTLADAKTRVEPRPVAELGDEAAGKQVTGSAPPAHKFPLDTVVVVEGKTDMAVLQRAAQLTGTGTDIRFFAVSQLDAARGDGVNEIESFVRDQRLLLPQRLPGKPMLVLLDWDTPDSRVRSIAAKYGSGGATRVAKMDAAWAHPSVGPTFRGIERMFSRRLLERADELKILSVADRRADGTLMVERDALERSKPALAELFQREARPEDCVHLRPALDWAVAVASGQLL